MDYAKFYVCIRIKVNPRLSKEDITETHILLLLFICSKFTFIFLLKYFTDSCLFNNESFSIFVFTN